jgi:hypothetical protein
MGRQTAEPRAFLPIKWNAVGGDEVAALGVGEE